ncbi:endoribonuclease L-PSP [Auriculariales sp. MPI-PUGE-AT-0066]|nr:endoribonuclease L-PSP [Auriculariales sp. MPI-PUGE-AT-0066]
MSKAFQVVSTDNTYVAPNVPLVQAIRIPAGKVCKNLEAVALAAGSDKNHIIKCNIYLKDMNDFARVNKVYGEFFAPHKPARTCIEVARLPLDVLVEIEGIAIPAE